METSGNDEHGGAEFIEGHEHLLGGLRLSHDAHFVFHGQDLRDAGTEDRLIVGQNELQHGLRSTFVAKSCGRTHTNQ